MQGGARRRGHRKRAKAPLDLKFLLLGKAFELGDKGVLGLEEAERDISEGGWKELLRRTEEVMAIFCEAVVEAFWSVKARGNA